MASIAGRTGIAALLFAGLALLVPAAGAEASTRGARDQVESSMLVTGSIDIATDGSVEAHRIDRPEELPPGVVTLLAKFVPDWKFEPVLVDGRAVRARTGMSIRIGARKLADGAVEVGVRNASFSDGKPGGIVSVDLTPPRFPMSAAMKNIAGTVYLVLRVAPDGTVAEAIDEQVNLRVLGTESQLRQGRETLAKTSVAAALKWRFSVTPEAIAEGGGYAYVRVPVDYYLGRARAPAYGIWDAYIPGPVKRMPWQLEEVDPGFSPDAQVAGTLMRPGAGPRLLTRLGEG